LFHVIETPHDLASAAGVFRGARRLWSVATMSRPRIAAAPRSPAPHRTSLRLEVLEERNLLDASTAHILVGYQSAPGTTPAVRGIEVPVGETVDQALAIARADPGVIYAEYDAPLQVEQLPDDPSFTNQWGLENTTSKNSVVDADIDASGAWDITTGSTKTVVAVIDTGVDYKHVDLYRNIWINQGEIPPAIKARLVDTDGDGLVTFRDLNDSRNQGAGKITDLNRNGIIDGGDVLYTTSQGGWADGISNDGDKYVDDIIGWNFNKNNNNPLDDNGHGTHVSGILGATGDNGVGVAGVNWQVQIMALKITDSSGVAPTSAAVEALNYAVDHGAALSNHSYGGGAYSQAMYDAIDNARAHGHVVVTSAGNGDSSGSGYDLDTNPSYPASYNLANVVTVAATSKTDNITLFSNYGTNTVDLAAPGLNVYSTIRNNKYGYYTGTSMAAPFVTGTLALLKARHPDWKYYQLIDQVLNTTDARSTLTAKTASGGRLNAGKALRVTPADTVGPRVVSAKANASGTDPVSAVRVTFSEGVDASSFTASDVKLTGPNGPIAVAKVTPVYNADDRQFDITFAPQSSSGTYILTVGPDVRDLAGNKMNQNANGVSGENPQDVFVATFVVETTHTFTSTTQVAIKDKQTVTATLKIDDALTIGDVNVLLNIKHTFDNDLYIRLRSPDGTEVLLVNRRGLSGDNFTNTVLDDEAAKKISRGSAPFTGSFSPEGSLSAFDGKSAKGTWTLIIEDRQSGDAGTLLNWSLVIENRSTTTTQSVGHPHSTAGRSTVGGTAAPVRVASVGTVPTSYWSWLAPETPSNPATTTSAPEERVTAPGTLLTDVSAEVTEQVLPPFLAEHEDAPTLDDLLTFFSSLTPAIGSL
jgi:subtilisin family serine protease/subtilisin-like proprotein convertase family protein